MFQTKIKEMCQRIHESIGQKRIKDCFLVDIDFMFVIKAVTFLTNFINKNCFSKPWNRREHFPAFIKPKNNFSISLKDHRFNKLNDGALTLLYHLDDIAAYLDKHQSVVNGISVLDRTFIDMEILKLIFSAIALGLVGIHISRPFHALIMNSGTTYLLLLESYPKPYPKLYEKLQNIELNALLQTDDQVFHFASPKICKDSLPKQKLIDSLALYANCYLNKTAAICKIILHMFVEGIDHQKSSIFRFGQSQTAETSEDVLKISTVDPSALHNLNLNASVHNIEKKKSENGELQSIYT